jgi:hypothetical protein
VSVLDARGTRVTHRVVEVDAARHLLRLKGDANAVADPAPYPADRVDRVLFTVPAGGYVLSRLTGPVATLLLGAYLMFLLSVLLPGDRTSPHPGPPREPRTPRHRAGSTAAGLVLVLGLAAAGAPRPAPTLAAFTDAVPVGGTTVKAYTVPKPVITDCSTAVRTVTVTFTAVSSPYPLTYSAAVENGSDLPVTGTGGTRTVRYTPPLQFTPGATQTIRITAALPSTPAWTSTPANQTIRLPLLGLIPSCGAAS